MTALVLGSAPALLALRAAPVAAEVSLEASDSRVQRVHGMLLFEGRPFTGAVLEHDSAGATVSRSKYRDGRRDGESLGWYADGRPMYRRAYARDRETGTHTGWWPDGSVHFIYRYRDGRLEGTAREWFPNGQLYREFNYRAGQEEGAEKMWYPDGLQRANYVVHDGRRFGLPGTKGCTGEDSTKVTS